MGVSISTANAGATYEPIATTVFGSDAASFTFSSISTSYTDLVLVSNIGATSSVDLLVAQVGNGSVDTGSTYSCTYLLGNGSSPTSNVASNQTYQAITRNIGLTQTVGNFNAITHFMSYANSNFYKTMIGRANQTDNTYPGTEATVNLWRSTSAINAIKVFMTGGNIKAGSTFTLYGIKAA